MLRMNYGEDYSEYVKNPILARHIELINTLSNDRVFCILHTNEDGFFIEECCDNYYSHILTREECVELSNMFKEIAEELGG